jgi:hypothetical protein
MNKARIPQIFKRFYSKKYPPSNFNKNDKSFWKKCFPNFGKHLPV